MGTGQRQFFTLSLVGVFLLQSWLVYSDDAGRVRPPLSPAAQAGRDLWHDRNCQSCHQIFGFGGFLGPDLTNLARRLAPVTTPTAESEPGDSTDANSPLDISTGTDDVQRMQLAERLTSALTDGSDRMPAFHFNAQQCLELAAYLIEVDRMGIGQVHLAESRPPRELFKLTLGGALPPLSEWNASQREGMDIAIEKGCIDCHLPNGQSSFRARDLTRIDTELEAERVALVLRDGLPGKGMPSFALTDTEIASVRAFLALLAEFGDGVRGAFEASQSSGDASIFDLPWFEYTQ